MKSKSFIFLLVLVFMIVFSLSAVSADDFQTTDSGQVSGDVDVATVNPWNTSGELTYDIPSDADIKSAEVYVNVYSGSAKNSYGANANVSLKTINGENQIASEELWIVNGTTDGTVYPLNDHVDKCYSDYQMRYDVTDSLKGLNGTSISINVQTFKMENKTFDGRIKLIALVLAYDDGDDDVISYWLDSSQRWTKANVTTTFNTANVTNVFSAELINVALSSKDGNVTFNSKALGAPDNHTSGSTYQYSCWDVSDEMVAGLNTEMVSTPTGSSLKNVLTVLKVEEIAAKVSLATEYTNVATCYAGTNNTLTIKANANKAGKYIVELIADGDVVNSTEVQLDGEKETTLLLTDPTIRPVDETTVNGANNTKVTYAVALKYNNDIVTSAFKTVPVLYNGNLGYDMEYTNTYGFGQFTDIITGDIVIDIKDVSSYLGTSASANNRTDVWTINLTDDSYLADALLFIPYNWFNAKSYNETADMFNLTFNGETISPVAHYRDQGNLGNYGKYGYGIFIYDVTDLLETSGDNTLVLFKTIEKTPAVYPSALVYMYNTEGGTLKEVQYVLGADLLANSNNDAGRLVESKTNINMLSTGYVNATLYVLAASAQAGEGNIVFNGEEFVNVWNGTSSTTDLFTADVTSILAESNNITFVATGSTIVSYPQFIVADSGISFSVDSIKPEYTSVPSAYAGTNNTLTVTVSSDVAGEFDAYLYADGEKVAEVTVTLVNGTNTISLTDPTIRPIDKTTENGANNTKVTYMVLVDNGLYHSYNSITLPVLYNGNLGYDMEYNAGGFGQYYSMFTGDMVIDIKDVSSYLGTSASANNRTDVWTINLTEGSNLADAMLLIPYNWFNAKLYNETADMFNLTFNGETISPVAHYRDQGNLGNYGKYGYGIFAYDVTDLLNASGDNTLVLFKTIEKTPAVYPSVLVYMYNTDGGSIKEAQFVLGTDLLANTNNLAGRAVKSDTNIKMLGTDYVNATLYVLAGGAEAGEGNIVFNGEEFVNVWSGTSSTIDLFTADVTSVMNKNNNISFVSTGKTIVSFPQFIVADTGIYLSIDSISPEYTSVPSAYAGTNNTLTITVTSNVSGQFKVKLYADGEKVANGTVDLISGTNKIYITDPTIRPIDKTTVNGANNTEVTYKVSFSYEGYACHKSITLPVLYNGNLGYDMEYNVHGFDGFNEVISGDIVFDIKDDSTYLGTSASANNRTDVWTVNLTDGSEIADAYLFIPYNWFNAKLYNETADMFNVTFNGETISPVAHYRDQGNLGNYGKYGYGIFIYDVTDLLNASGDNTLVLFKTIEKTPAVYPSALVYMYNTEGGNLKEVSFVLGADLLANSNNLAGRPVESNTVIKMGGTDYVNATLYVLAGGAEAGEGNIVFNGEEFVNVWSGTSSTTDLFTTDVTAILAKSNDITFVSTGKTIVSFPQFIVADTGVHFSVDSIKTEYTSVLTAYAGTNNTLTVEVSTSADGEYEVYLYADGEVVDNLTVNLTKGSNTLLLTDPTIRPINETTVNGADNTKVKYSVVMNQGASHDEGSITVPVLYSGNFGKDLEYNATYIEDRETYAVTGGIQVVTQPDTTYMSGSAVNRVDVFNIDLDNSSSLEKVFVYLAYNWDKSGVNGPVFNVTFNNNPVNPRSAYRDQGNLGNYGKYGYGLFIYDVTEFAQAGNNTLVINKEKGLTAVYPSTLIYLYNTTDSRRLTTVFMANGADLLSNDYNKAGRVVKTSDVIEVESEDMVSALLCVFAASAQAGEGNIVFNGDVDVDVWSGSSNSFDTYIKDITDTVNCTNDIEFVATKSTILALSQMIVTKSIIKVVPKVVIEVPEDIKPGDNVSVTISIDEAIGEVVVMVDGAERIVPFDENGTASFVIENVTDGVHAIGALYLGDVNYYPGMGVKGFEAVPVIPTATKFENITIAGDLTVSAVLVDVEGNPVSNAVIDYAVGGVANSTVTGADGSFVIAGANGVAIDIAYAGSDVLQAANTTIKLANVAPVVVQVEARFNITNNAITIYGYAVDKKAGEQGIAYATTLLDASGNPISGAFIQFGLNSKIYNRTTNENGTFDPYHLNMVRAGVYTMAFYFAGNENYTSAFAIVAVNLEKKPITIKASAKTYKASAKTKKYTVTLSTIVGSSADGKAHLRTGFKVTMKINGQTYTGKTNSKGQVTFNLKITKKGKYTATISTPEDQTYVTTTKSVKITIN